MKQAFKIQVPDEAIDDLRRRLASTRWPEEYAGSDWDAGASQPFLRRVVARWRDDYSWPEREKLLNRFDHYLANVDGVQLHFIEARSEDAKAIPLLLMGGWPSSFVQMLDILPLLTRPGAVGEASFHVIVASLPGYPFTTFPGQGKSDFGAIADLVAELMSKVLGFERFAVRGSDQGGIVLQHLGLRHPDRLIGVHRSGITPFASPLPDDLSVEEQKYQEQVRQWAIRETAYAQLQSWRPETLTPALTDSPVALAAWFLEKFQRWGDVRDGLEAAFGLDRLLDNLSLHWFTRSAATSTRLYREARLGPAPNGRVEVPTAILMPQHDGVTIPAPKEWCERSFNVVRFTQMERGGHFAEWEAPDLVARDLRSFFAMLSV